LGSRKNRRSRSQRLSCPHLAGDGDLAFNDWEKSTHGEDFARRLGQAGRSDVLEYLSDVLAPKIEALDVAFAEE
jgi:hypothetical protein